MLRLSSHFSGLPQNSRKKFPCDQVIRESEKHGKCWPVWFGNEPLDGRELWEVVPCYSLPFGDSRVKRLHEIHERWIPKSSSSVLQLYSTRPASVLQIVGVTLKVEARARELQSQWKSLITTTIHNQNTVLKWNFSGVPENSSTLLSSAQRKATKHTWTVNQMENL